MNIRLTAAALVAAFAAAPAGAATLVNSYEIRTEVGGRAIAAFDAALGTLESVEVVLAVGAYRAIRLDAAPGSTVTGLLTSAGRVSTTFGALDVAAEREIAFTGGDIFAPNATNERRFSYAGADAARFLQPLRFDFDGPSGVSTQFALRDGVLAGQSYPSGRGYAGATASARITYNYSAALAVPEPAAWATLLVGFGAVGVALRGQRRRTPAAA